MDIAQIEKIQNSNLILPRVTLWEKNGRSRLYVDGCGYITEDRNDVRGFSSGEFKGFYYHYLKPGKVGTLRDVIRIIAED